MLRRGCLLTGELRHGQPVKLAEGWLAACLTCERGLEACGRLQPREVTTDLCMLDAVTAEVSQGAHRWKKGCCYVQGLAHRTLHY